MKPLIVRDLIIQDGAFSICVTLAPTSMHELKKDLLKLKTKDFDLLEWRADYLMDHRELETGVLSGILLIREAFPHKPFLFTFRWDQEGGQSHISREELFSIRKKAVESGKIDLIDVELHWLRNAQSDEKLSMYVNLLALAKASGISCILSWHDFNETPEEDMLLKILTAQMRLGGDICKISTMAKTEEDTLRMLNVSRRAAKTLEVPHIAMVMGDYGKSSRYDKSASKSCITFAPLNQSTAPGQFSLEEIKMRLEKY